MKKFKFIICIILCITLLVPITANASSMKEPGVVSRGLSEVIIAICDFCVSYYNDFGISVVGMMRQGKETDEYKKDYPTTYNLTTVTVDDNKVTSGLFNDVTSKFYPKLMMISIIVFLVGLIYIGILTLMSSASAKKQEYMQRLNTWFFGLVLMLAFGIIMVFLIKVNNALANTFLDIGEVTYNSAGGGLPNKPKPKNTNPNKLCYLQGDNSTQINILDLINKARPSGGNGTYPVTNGLAGAEEKKGTVKIKEVNLLNQVEWWDGKGATVFNNFWSSNKSGIVSPYKPAGLLGSSKGESFNYIISHDGGISAVNRALILASGGKIGDPGSQERSLALESQLGFDKASPMPILRPGPEVVAVSIPSQLKKSIYLSKQFSVVVTPDGVDPYCLMFYLDAQNYLHKGFSEGENQVDCWHEPPTNVALAKNAFYGYVYKTGISDWTSLNIRDTNIGPIAAATWEISTNRDGVYQMADDAEEGVLPNDELLQELYNQYFTPDNVGRIEYALLYFMGVLQVFILFMTYVIRTFMISFLILIFPVVMAIYCLDKINDNKSGVFTKWLKEFISNVFTNSMHALSYGIMFSVILMAPSDPTSPQSLHPIVKVIALWFIIPSGKILRSVFDIQSEGSKHSDHAGLAALGGVAALSKAGGGKFESTANKWKTNAQNANNGGGGSGSGGGAGGGGGSGGSGGGGAGGKSWGRRALSGALRGGASIVGTGATVAGGLLGASIGVARNAAAGEDLGQIVTGGVAGAGVGAGLTRAGGNLVHAGYHRFDQGVKFGKEGMDGLKARSEKKRLESALQGQRENLKDLKVPEVKANLENNKMEMFRPVQSTGNATRYTKDGKTYETRGGQEYRVEDNGYLYNESAGGYLYENEAFATVDGDFSSHLGGSGNSTFYMPVDQEGYIDANRTRGDNSVIDNRIQEQFAPQDNYINGSLRSMGINLKQNENLSHQTVYDNAVNHVKQNVSAGEKQDSALARLQNLRRDTENFEKQKSDTKDQLIKQQATAARSFANSHVLRPLSRPLNVNDI